MGLIPIGALPEVLPATPTREQILALETHMRAMPQMELEAVHYFAKGIYARELTIPAGTLLTGMIHKTEHLNILSAGEITVWTEDGMKRLAAPTTIVSRPGTKRVGYAHSETVWTTIHGTDLTDLAELEAALVETEQIAHCPPEGLPCLGPQ